MARKKYARDYRLSDTLDERGRIRTETEYIGAFYRFSEYAAARTALKRMLLFSSLGALCFFLSLLPRSTASLTLYVMLPYLFTALPFGLLITSLLRLRSMGERLDHRSADLANERVPGCCFWLMLLPALSLLGELTALTLCRKAFLPGDGLFLAGALGVGICGLLCARKKSALRAVPESG